MVLLKAKPTVSATQLLETSKRPWAVTSSLLPMALPKKLGVISTSDQHAQQAKLSNMKHMSLKFGSVNCRCRHDRNHQFFHFWPRSHEHEHCNRILRCDLRTLVDKPQTGPCFPRISTPITDLFGIQHPATCTSKKRESETT